MMVIRNKFVISACLYVFVVLASAADEEPKRDKRTVDILLRGAADLFGYDVVRRLASPTLRQGSATPRPTFFPPPVAPQLPTGTYSRVILALGQQQQQQQQQLQRRLEEALQVPPVLTEQFSQPQAAIPQTIAHNTAVINIPENGALTARAESLSFPRGGLFPVLQAPAQVAQVPLLSPVAQLQHILPVAPIAVQSAAFQIAPLQTQQLTPQQSAAPPQQAAPQQVAPQQVAPQQAAQQQAAPQQAPPQQSAVAVPQQSPPPQAPPQNPTDGNNPTSPFGIPLQIVAIAPAQSFGPNGQLQNGLQGQNSPQGQNSAQGQSAPQGQNLAQQAGTPSQSQENAQPSQGAEAAPANSAGAQQTQPQTPANNGLSIVFDQGPTRWNLFSLPRQESVRRSLNLNLNWNRNVEPASAPQFQLVPVPAPTSATASQQAQQAPSTQIPLPPQQNGQQRLPPPSPTLENFDITTQAQTSNSQFNRYYNIPENFQARTAAQKQNSDNQQFRDSVRRFWETTAAWNNGNRDNIRANLQEELRPRFEEYNLESNTEELNSPESEQIIIEENNEVVAPSDDISRREEYNDGNEENKTRSRRFRLNSDRLDEETREASDTPKYRRRNKIRRIRKVKKTFDDNDESKSKLHQLYKREKKSIDSKNDSSKIKNYYKKFTLADNEKKE